VPAEPTGRFTSFAAATDQVAAEIFDSCLDRPTLVVWLFDQTESAMDVRSQVAARLAQAYELFDQIEFGPPSTGDEATQPWLTTAVGAFAAETEFVLQEPTSERQAVIDAVSSIRTGAGGEEHTFGAIAETVERFGPRAAQEQRRLILVVATDETGDDDERVDELVPRLRKAAIPLYVIGMPAPFGSRESLSGIVAVEAFRPVRQGPESLEGEVLNLGGWQADWKPVDSGFGPFGLSRLALASGGRFLAMRPVAAYDPVKLAAYAPDYVTRARYEEMLQANRARRAVVDAGRQQRIDLGVRLETEFVKKDDADLKRKLDQAQRNAARLEPKLQAIYPTIEAGQADAAKLVEPRWQANYYLALGRIAAARARIEGYNAALAQLKLGRAFPDPSHTTWVLRPAEEVRGDSALEKLANVARKSLARVQTDHPDTPWATLAARELAAPMGWKWESQ